MPTALITHSIFSEHEMLPGHPENPHRLRVIHEHLLRLGISDFLLHADAPMAAREQIERVHSGSHIDNLAEHSPRHGLAFIDGDTSMNPSTLEAAWRAAGGAALATDMVLSGKVHNAFCALRPPGHHAERHRAMGFCFFNNIAVAAAQALEVHHLSRVAILDFDVHHGNGTENIFRNDERVMVCSVYQYPLYPFIDTAYMPGHLINTPLPGGAGSKEFRHAVSDIWLPELDSFQPEMVLISAGFDAHRDDPLAGLNLVDSDFEWITDVAMQLAQRHAGGRLVSCLEGGYDLGVLSRCVPMHIKKLAAL
jgi:acetoin utilization deacetylase AcuC-like enzyme